MKINYFLTTVMSVFFIYLIGNTQADSISNNLPKVSNRDGISFDGRFINQNIISIFIKNKTRDVIKLEPRFFLVYEIEGKKYRLVSEKEYRIKFIGAYRFFPIFLRPNSVIRRKFNLANHVDFDSGKSIAYDFDNGLFYYSLKIKGKRKHFRIHGYQP